MRINFKRASFMGVMITLAMMILVGFTPLKASAKGVWVSFEDVIEIKLGETVTIDGSPVTKYYHLNKRDYISYELPNGKEVKVKLKNLKFKVKNKKIASYDKKKFSVKGLKVGYTTLTARYNGNNITTELHVLCKKHNYETKTVNPEPGKAGYTVKVCKKCHHEKNKKTIEYKYTEAEVKAKLQELRQKYPEGTEVGICGEYANMLAAELFNKPLYRSAEDHTDITKLKIGDFIEWKYAKRIVPDDKADHVVCVTDISTDSSGLTVITYTDANHGWDRKSHWDNKITIIDGGVCHYYGPNKWIENRKTGKGYWRYSYKRRHADFVDIYTHY